MHQVPQKIHKPLLIFLLLKQVLGLCYYCIEKERYSEKERHIPAAPGRCSFQTEAWLGSFGGVIQRTPSPT